MQKYKALFWQLVFFGVVGVITLLVDVTITTVLFNALHFPAYLASAVGFMSGFFFNFPINRKKVFHHSDSDRFSLRTQVILFVSLSIFNLLATSAVVELLVSNNLLTISYAKIVVTALIATWNFILLRQFIFGKKSGKIK